MSSETAKLMIAINCNENCDCFFRFSVCLYKIPQLRDLPVEGFIPNS